MKKILCILFLLQLLTGVFVTAGAEPSPVTTGTKGIFIIDKPVICTERRKQLMREYSRVHYGEGITEITPRAIVIHWTSSEDMSSAYSWFNREEYRNAPGTLNVGSQFMVDRDGSIYRLMPETALARHSIGYNWCAVGIENVGGKNHKEVLTDAQLKANIHLIRYLAAKYPSIKFVWGHYQQNEAKETGLYRELVFGYYSDKDDPGPLFMHGLQAGLADVKQLTFIQDATQQIRT